MIDCLRALTLQKLHKRVVGFELFETRIKDVTALVSYAHSEDLIPNRNDEGKVDGLRDLIVAFVATEFDIISKTAGFRTLVEEGREFASNLFTMLSNELLEHCVMSCAIGSAF